MPRKRTDTVHAGFTARLRDLRVPGPPTRYGEPSTQTAPTPAECGRPSGRTVATKNVRSACGVSLARMSRGRLHGSSADPYWSRLRVEIGSLMLSVIYMRRTGRPQIHTRTDENRPCRAGRRAAGSGRLALPVAGAALAGALGVWLALGRLSPPRA